MKPSKITKGAVITSVFTVFKAALSFFYKNTLSEPGWNHKQPLEDSKD